MRRIEWQPPLPLTRLWVWPIHISAVILLTVNCAMCQTIITRCEIASLIRVSCAIGHAWPLTMPCALHLILNTYSQILRQTRLCILLSRLNIMFARNSSTCAFLRLRNNLVTIDILKVMDPAQVGSDMAQAEERWQELMQTLWQLRHNLMQSDTNWIHSTKGTDYLLDLTRKAHRYVILKDHDACSHLIDCGIWSLLSVCPVVCISGATGGVDFNMYRLTA